MAEFGPKSATVGLAGRTVVLSVIIGLAKIRWPCGEPVKQPSVCCRVRRAQVSTVAVSVQLVGCRYVGLPRYVRLMFRAAPGYLKVTAVSLARPFVYRGNSEEGVCDCSPQ